ncbi:PHP domain-containing protein [Acidobacteriota bacterium]
MPNAIVSSFNGVRNKSYGSRFFKVDFHFHTPASGDAVRADKYAFKPYNIKFPSPKSNLSKYKKDVQDLQVKKADESEVLAVSIVEKLIEQKVSLVAVTDHNTIGTLYNDYKAKTKVMDLDATTWYELISDTAEELIKLKDRVKLEVLPGAEITTAGVHILAVFPPQNPKKRAKFLIEELLDEVGFVLEKWGDVNAVGCRGIYDTVKLIEERGGFPIIAHIDQGGKGKKALRGLYKDTSYTMAREISNESLPAVEVVNPNTLSRMVNSTMTLYGKFKDVRVKKGFEPLAYFQGSDAHKVDDIAKRYTYVKMSSPSFMGLVDSAQAPNSRIRMAAHHVPLTHGLFLYGVELDYGYFNKQSIRFNRHFNCIIGKRQSGRTTFLDLLQKPLSPDSLGASGRIRLFVEHILESTSYYYAVEIDQNKRSCFKIDKNNGLSEECEFDDILGIGFDPEYYDQHKINKIISGSDVFIDFLNDRFGDLSIQANRKKFNKLFTVEDFLGDNKEKLFFADLSEGNIEISMNVNCGQDREKMKAFAGLDMSLRNAAAILIIIIGSRDNPILIDCLDTDLNNEDINDFMVPLLKKYKGNRQVILATSNSLIGVNADPENYILLEREKKNSIKIKSGFSVDTVGEETNLERKQLVKIFDGSQREIKKRTIRYKNI